MNSNSTLPCFASFLTTQLNSTVPLSLFSATLCSNESNRFVLGMIFFFTLLNNGWILIVNSFYLFFNSHCFPFLFGCIELI